MRHRATATEAELRRSEVVRLRFARLSEPEIARRLGVSAATISRDLQAIHATWGDRLRSAFDVAVELAEAVAPSLEYHSCRAIEADTVARA